MSRDETTTVVDAIGQEWLKRLKYAKEARAAFDAVANACYSFYSKSGKFMWEEKFKRTYLGNVETPKFEVTINAAKEYVDIFGPFLFWDYPHRTAKPYERLELDPAAFMDPQDPYAEEAFAAMVQEQDLTYRVASQRAKLMERYLNYSQREQPHGLWQHSSMAIIDALVKGRGVLVPRAYSPPDSDRVLTGLFYEPVQNLYIDPDCSDPLLDTASWVAIRHESASYDLEDRFNIPRGTLDEAGIAETTEHIVENDSDTDKMHRVNGKSNNIIVWYEIWSKCGISCKKDRQQSEFAKHVNSVVGDHVYLCVAAGVPWLLNAPPAKFEEDPTDEEVSEMMGWPFPSYKDSRWPMALLDFGPDPESAWPIAPLSAGLGHLICLNVLMSAYVEQAYENRKSIIAVLDVAAKDVMTQIKGNESPAVVQLKNEVAKDIKNVIQYLNRPNMNNDILGAIELVMMLFQKATGLVDFMYGSEQKVSRSAQDIVAKQEKTAVRPEKMSKDVAAWQADAARLEAFLAALEVQGEDVHPMIPAQLWDRLVTQQDPEMVMREMDVVIEATDVRRPNRERDLANLQTLAQSEMPLHIKYGETTGDSGPLNAFRREIWKSMEQPFTPEMELGPWQPQPPPPEVQQQMQMEQQAEQAKEQAELQKLQMELEAKQLDAQQKQMAFEFKAQADQQKLQVDGAKAAQDMQFNSAKASQDLSFNAARERQNLMFDQLGHTQELRQDEEDHELSMVQAEEQGQQKVRLMRQQAMAKPKTNGSSKK